MNFETRATGLASAYGFTPRQARFLTLVALISGYCLRRQYGAFAGIALGKNPAAFLDELVRCGLATRHRPSRRRSFVYHLKHRSLYDALGLADNRHRRPVAATRQARQLMLLDFAISHPTVTWYATEADKVELFTKTLGVPSRVLPGRIYRGPESTDTTLRQFVLKLPIYCAPDNPTVHFVYLGLDTSGQGLSTFLADHGQLFQHVPAWQLVIVHPPFLRPAVRTWKTTVARTHFLESPGLSSADARELHAYFLVHHALAEGSSAPVTIDHVYEQRRRRFSTSPHAALYEHWRAVGGPHLSADTPPDFSDWQPTGTVTTFELPHSYDLYGSYPGVA
jgi:hypothetical protein